MNRRLTRAAARLDLFRSGLAPELALADIAALYATEFGSVLDSTDAHYDGPSRTQAAWHNGATFVVRA